MTERTAETVAQAIDIGYRMIDTARDYGGQAGISEAIGQLECSPFDHSAAPTEGLAGRRYGLPVF